MEQKTGAGLLFVILGLYGAVYSTVEAQPQVGFEMVTYQLVGVWVVLALLIGAIFLMRTLNLKQLFLTIASLSFVGMVLSSFLVYAHYATAGAFCPAGTQGIVACDIVNQSMWSEILGIPVSALGVVYYLVFFVIALVAYTKYAKIKKKKLNDPLYRHWFLILSIGGLLFTIWLNYVQFFELLTLCPLCEMSATTVILLFAASIWSIRKLK